MGKYVKIKCVEKMKGYFEELINDEEKVADGEKVGNQEVQAISKQQGRAAMRRMQSEKTVSQDNRVPM